MNSEHDAFYSDVFHPSHVQLSFYNGAILTVSMEELNTMRASRALQWCTDALEASTQKANVLQRDIYFSVERAFSSTCAPPVSTGSNRSSLIRRDRHQTDTKRYGRVR